MELLRGGRLCGTTGRALEGGGGERWQSGRMPRPRMRDLFSPLHGTPQWVMGAGHQATGRGLLGRKRGPFLLFRNVHCPYADPRWAGEPLACHFGCSRQDRDAVNTHTRLSCRVSKLPAITAICSHGTGPKPSAQGTVPGSDWFRGVPPKPGRGPPLLRGPGGAAEEQKTDFLLRKEKIGFT